MVLEVTPSPVTRKAFGLRNNFRFVLYGSGRKQPPVCATMLKHSILSNCAASQPLLLIDGKRCKSVLEGLPFSFLLPSFLSEI